VLKGATLHHKAEIRKAAEIAAWYSAAKHSKLVPVMYTLKKYVRRAKNHAPGQVIVEREEVLMVRPMQGTE
jgi:predicted ribosome quality control (RQC) complex YloA/Tae2 family protein